VHELVPDSGDRPVTARVTTLKGADAGRYYVEALPSYYLDSGEPPGRWHGAGADALGLAGDVVDDAFLRVLAGEHPVTGRRLGTRFCDRSARGFDVTCSAPKSVSLLVALGDDTVRCEALAAHDAAVNSMVDWIEAHAHTRYRVHGQVGVYDADGTIAACFRQHTSRALDPQLHTHVVIANRVLSSDGRWLALDARTIKHDQRTLSALYHAGLRAELTRRLGVRWHQPVNGIAEIADAPDELLAAFSTRSDQVEARLEEKLDRFQATVGREPTPRERWRLERETVTDSRPAKTHLDAAALRDEWLDRAITLGHHPETMPAGWVDRAEPSHLDETVTSHTVDGALTALAERQSAWRPAELVRELAAHLPTTIQLRAEELWSLLDQLANEVVAERCLDLTPPVADGVRLRRDGRPVTESALDRIVTLPAIIAEEERVLERAETWVTAGGDHRAPVTGDRDQLTGDQLAAACAVAGDRRLVLIVGPAGTGKTTALRPAIAQLKADGRVVFGVAPSATAAEVLAIETRVSADTVDKLLIEHQLARPPAPLYDLPAGSTVLVDEAAMVATPKLAALFDLADRHGWRLALAGDPLQFSAVGRSGLFGYLVDTLGAVELGRVHRFTERWEAHASLRLRHGDTSVVDLYDQHGRLHGGTAIRMRGEILGAWWRATHRGESVAMVAPTNDAVVALNQRAQQLRLDGGELDDSRAVAGGPYRLHVGDLVATRHNDRRLRTDQHLMVKNRDHWTVTAITGSGITVSGPTGTVTLPPGYVREYVELAYAETSHASQGRTVDRSLLYLDDATNTAGIYVPMTRGRRSNDAFIVVHGEHAAADILTESLARSWIDRPAIQQRAERGAQPAQPRGSEPDRILPVRLLRQLLERAHELDQFLARRQFDFDHARRNLANIKERRAGLRRTIADYEARLDVARDVLARHERPLHRRRHRYDIDGANAQLGWIPDALDKARRELETLDHDETTARRHLAEATLVAADGDRTHDERKGIDTRLTSDRRARARALASDPPTWILDRLGERSATHASGDAWDNAAGRLAQHRAAFADDNGRLDRGIRAGLYEAACDVSRRAAAEAIRGLDTTRGRDLGMDAAPRGLSL
jgi:conjugative relaxase-like TrwC/TraI family protein